MTALIDEHRDAVAQDERRLPRSRLEAFVRLSGRSAFGDVSVFTVLDAYRLAWVVPQAGVTGYASRLVDCLDEVHHALGGMADGPEEVLQGAFTSVPPTVMLRASEPDVHFHLVCVTAAHSALDGIDSPYLAARTCANMRILRPPEDFGITATGERLAIRYEDEPDARAEIDVEIRAEMVAYLAAVPFDV